MHIPQIGASLLAVTMGLMGQTPTPAPAPTPPSIAPAQPTLYATTLPASSSTCTVHVAAGVDLQAALNNANPGDTLCIQAGGAWTGNYIVPSKPNPNAAWLTIRTSTPDAQLPPPGTRINPSNIGLMATITSPNVAAAIATAPGMNHLRMIGLEIDIAPQPTAAPGTFASYYIVEFGDGSDTTTATLASDLVIDRCYIHGQPNMGSKRGVQVNSMRTAVIDSYISEIHNIGQDTQDIAGWNGPGPFKVVNNYLAASGENILFGGAPANSPALMPQDGEIRGNYLFKSLTWNPADATYAGIHWEAKNLFEIKDGSRFLVDGNVMQNSWVDAQSGFAIFLQGLPNEDGLFAIVQDVTISNNQILNSYSGIAFCAWCFYAPVQTTNPAGANYADPTIARVQRVLISNNLIEGAGHVAGSLDGDDVKWDHNTILNASTPGNSLATSGAPGVSVPPAHLMTRFDFTNNIAFWNAYGLYGNDSQPFTSYMISPILAGGLYINNQATGAAAPASNLMTQAIPATIFRNYNNGVGGDYHLVAGSPYAGAATDGTDIGANIDTLNAHIATAISGNTTPIGPATVCGPVLTVLNGTASWPAGKCP
jgi:hypothetical protein